MSAAPERLAEIDRLLDELLDTPPTERATRLAGVRSRDPELAREVEELLAGAEEPGESTVREWVAGPLWQELEARLAGEEDALDAGERFGAWRVMGEIGRGGMAVVFLAERADGAFTQKVALKLLQQRGGGEEAIRRFEQERQILASFKHPSIARLLDGGVSPSGRPYLVLEHVEGEPIDRYCDRHRLSVDKRLDLFAQVVRAVDFAHKNLVVHRDLKPSNILVEDDGTVKLLDFGIAKLLDAQVAGEFAAPPTRTLLRLMTPEYASPEQVRGEPVTTASDVYQLGLLLYELLTGERAYRLADGSPSAVERTICTEEPRLPSHVASEAAAEARHTSPAALARRLAGDLDNILLTALAKEPERRYGTAKELSDDLERHRQGLPVRARQPTLGYRVGKFARRHRLALAAAAALLFLLVGYAVTVTLQAAEIARERDRARAEATKAREVTGFLSELFESVDPDQARGREVTAREVLDQASGRIDSRLGSQPEIQVELLHTVGEMYEKLGLYSAGEPLLRRAVERARALGAAGRPLLAECLVSHGDLLRQQGHAEAAEGRLREALALARRLPGAELRVARATSELALTLQDQRQLAPATRLLREALALREQALGPEHPEVAESLSLLAGNLRLEGDLAMAERLHRRSVELRRRVLPSDHADLATAINDLALTLMDQGRYADAEPLLREALTLQEKVYGPDHPRAATASRNLAQALWRQGSFADALPLVRRALAIQRARLPERNPVIATTLSFLGRVLQDGGDLEGAKASYREALALYEPDHPQRLTALLNLGTALEAEGRYPEAEALYRETLAAHRRQLGDGHARVGLDLVSLGNVRLAQGDPAGAEPLLRQALALFRRALPRGHPDIARALLPLGRLLDQEGRAAEAGPLLEEALAIRRARYGDDDPRTEESRLALNAARSQ